MAVELVGFGNESRDKKLAMPSQSGRSHDHVKFMRKLPQLFIWG